MDILGDSQTTLLLGLTALLAGFIDAIAGGGGMLVMPVLLSTGMPPHLVLGTNKLVGTFGTFSAAFTFIHNGLFKPALWKATALGTFGGALTGALLIYMFNADTLKKLLPLAILAAALYLLLPGRIPTAGALPHRPPPRPSAKVFIGTAMGFYDGFIGPGTGAFWMAIAYRFFRQDIVQAAGVARFMNFMSNAAALLTFVLLGSVDYGIGLTMGVALMAGAFIGAHSAIRYGGSFIQTVFIVVVLLMAGRLVVAEFF